MKAVAIQTWGFDGELIEIIEKTHAGSTDHGWISNTTWHPMVITCFNENFVINLWKICEDLQCAQERRVQKTRKKYLLCKSRFFYCGKWKKGRLVNFLLFKQRSQVNNLQLRIARFFRLDDRWFLLPVCISLPDLDFFSLSCSCMRSEGNNRGERKGKLYLVTFWDQNSKPKRKLNTFFSHMEIFVTKISIIIIYIKKPHY